MLVVGSEGCGISWTVRDSCLPRARAALRLFSGRIVLIHPTVASCWGDVDFFYDCSRTIIRMTVIGAHFLKQSPLLCIICGCARSGTTLVSELLRQHPAVDGRFECGFLLVETMSDFMSLEPYVSHLKGGWGLTQESFAYICQASSWQMAYQRLIERSNLPDKSVRIYDKTPLYLRHLKTVMAKVEVPCICVVRDPRALYWSQTKRDERSLEHFCRDYVTNGKAWRAARNLFPERILLVRHELLCVEPESEARRIFGFLGLDFHADYLSLPNTRYPYVQRGGITDDVVLEYRSHLTLDQQEYLVRNTSEFSCWHWHGEDSQRVPPTDQVAPSPRWTPTRMRTIWSRLRRGESRPLVRGAPHHRLQEGFAQNHAGMVPTPRRGIWDPLRYLGELLTYRHMIRYLVIRDLKVRYRRSALGFAWSFLNPLLMMAVFTLVFTALRQHSIAKYPIFLLSGLLPWQWFSNAIMAASSSIASNAALVRKVYFPREVLPLVAVLSNLANYLLALIPFAAFMLLYQVPVTPWIALLPLVMIAQFLFTFGLGLILSTADVFYRDTKEIVQVIMSLWFFLTPIFYSSDTLSGTIARWINTLNPMAPIVSAYRAILYAGEPPQYGSLVPGLALSCVLVIVGHIVFSRFSGVFAEEV